MDTLEQIPADRSLVEALYSHGKITRAARNYALDFLYPHHQWGLWVSYILLTLGTTLVLAGILYFFAFNWAKMAPLTKLFLLQGGILISIVGACCRSLQRVSGQLLLLSASVLVGVFMAVFGQIYQTGASAYQLFMLWSLFTLGWTLLSKFAGQWLFWLVITNIFLILWWQQAALPSKDMAFIIFVYLAIFNGAALALREYFFAKQGYEWLDARWTRIILVLSTLLTLLIPMVCFIMAFRDDKVSSSLTLSGLIGVLGHAVAYCFYRYKRQDILALSAIVLSVCVMVETAGWQILLHVFNDRWEAGMLLLLGLMTIVIFTCAIIYLRNTAIIMESRHV
jgi:uncharacterized membrane protein